MSERIKNRARLTEGRRGLDGRVGRCDAMGRGAIGAGRWASRRKEKGGGKLGRARWLGSRPEGGGKEEWAFGPESGGESFGLFFFPFSFIPKLFETHLKFLLNYLNFEFKNTQHSKQNAEA